MLGSTDLFWGYRCTDVETRNAAHVCESLVVYGQWKITYKSIKEGDLLVTSVKQNATRVPIAFMCDCLASAEECVRLCSVPKETRPTGVTILCSKMYCSYQHRSLRDYYVL